MPFVISKLSADTEFVLYNFFNNGKELRNEKVKSVLIRGGNGVIEHGTFVTPDNGVITEITEEEKELLQNLPAFKMQEEAGFVKIIGNPKEQNKASDNMMPDDSGAQLTEDDFSEESGYDNRTDLKINGKKVEKSSNSGKKSQKRK